MDMNELVGFCHASADQIVHHINRVADAIHNRDAQSAKRFLEEARSTAGRILAETERVNPELENYRVYTVSEDVEVVLDGEKYLLENGDCITIGRQISNRNAGKDNNGH